VRKIIFGFLAVGVLTAAASLGVGGVKAADEAAPAATPAGDAAPAADAKPAEGGGDAAACCEAGDTTPPLDLIKKVPVGGLHNPYNDQIDAIAEEGHHKYLSFSCNGCHGGGGGGGMCPPLTNDAWIYGADDDTLFRLVSLGSDGLKKDYGYKRVKQEVVVGPMPPFGGIIKTSDDLWKVIAFIRSKNPSSMKRVSEPAPQGAPAQ
jgi:mono/diheme cytochrome c family protein